MLRISFEKFKPTPDALLTSTSPPPSETPSLNDIKALEDLMELWDEGHIDQTDITEAESLFSDSPASAISLTPSLTKPLSLLNSQPKDYKPKSKTFPALHGNPNVWAFIQQVTEEIKKTKWKGLHDSNLTHSQLEALFSLQKNQNLVVKPSDKGGNLVIVERYQYESMVMRLLNNRDWYKKISEGHIQLMAIRYRQLIESAYHQGLINKSTWEFLNVPFPRTPTLYALPRIHKDLKNASRPPYRVRKWMFDRKGKSNGWRLPKTICGRFSFLFTRH